MRKLFLFMALCCASAAHAELKWDKPELIFRPVLTDKKAVGDFTFTNAGTAPVTIQSVEPSCDCTTVDLTKKTYAPGEKGKITVTFDFGDRSGLKEKTIQVTTDDSKDGYELKMTVYLPDAPDIAPTYCYWHKDEDREPKTVSVKIGKDCPFKTFAPDLVCSDERVKADFKTIVKEKEYTMVIKLKSTKEPFNATVDLYSMIPAGSPRKFRVHVGVLKD